MPSREAVKPASCFRKQPCPLPTCSNPKHGVYLSPVSRRPHVYPVMLPLYFLIPNIIFLCKFPILGSKLLNCFHILVSLPLSIAYRAVRPLLKQRSDTYTTLLQIQDSSLYRHDLKAGPDITHHISYSLLHPDYTRTRGSCSSVKQTKHSLATKASLGLLLSLSLLSL